MHPVPQRRQCLSRHPLSQPFHKRHRNTYSNQRNPSIWKNLARSGGAGLGIGVGAAFVTSVITAILALAVSSSVLDQITDTFNAFGSLSSDNLFGNTRDMNILQSIIFFMVQGVAGGFSITYQGDGFFSSSSTESAWLGAGLSGFALLLGTAFGVYLLGRKNTIHLRWMGVASSAVVGVAAGIVYEILGLIGRIQISAITVSGTSVRTFFMAFLFAGDGALIVMLSRKSRLTRRTYSPPCTCGSIAPAVSCVLLSKHCSCSVSSRSLLRSCCMLTWRSVPVKPYRYFSSRRYCP